MNGNSSKQAVHVGLILVPLATWACHFLFVYVSAALVCAKAANADEAFDSLYWLVAVATIAALASTGFTALRGRSAGRAAFREAAADSEQRFVGNMLLMLSMLSAVAIVAVAAVTAFFGDCRP